jgi:hypothetical protein
MNKSSKKFLSAGIILTALAMTPVVFAQSNTSDQATHPVKMENHLQQKYQFAKMLTVTSINGNTITGTDKTGTSYTVDASQAQDQRRFKGTSSLSEMSASDKILVMGDLNGTAVTAKIIRDVSIHAKNSGISGQVTAVSTNSFTISNPRGVSFTVNIDANTKFAGPKTHTLNSLTDLKVGDHVMVAGIKNDTTKTETAKLVKYFDPTAVKGTAKKELGKKMGKMMKKHQNDATSQSSTQQ